MARDEERLVARRSPIVGGVPELPGILAAMAHAGLGVHARASPTSCSSTTIRARRSVRAEREMLATAVSRPTTASSAWTPTPRSRQRSSSGPAGTERIPLLDGIKEGSSDGLDPKMQALLHIARVVRRTGWS